ncbi:MAG: YbaY family lipoprotein [Candidatus Rariloculaceae bacterium]
MKVLQPGFTSTLLVCAVALSGCAQTPVSDFVQVTATYRERIAMPPGAVLEASILDVSIADVIAETMGSVRIEDAGNPPYNFAIPFDPETIDHRLAYAVRASLLVEDQLIFTTDTVYPVLTRGAGRDVDLLLRRASRSGGSANDLAPAPSTFTGILPCADYPGIFHHLNLFPDGSYLLRKSYLDRGEGGIVDEIGSWDASRDNKLLL